MVAIGFVLVVAAHAQCPITVADVPACDQPDSFYELKICEIPRLYEPFPTFDSACTAVMQVLGGVPDCDLSASIANITDTVLRKGCMTTQGEFIIKSSAVKTLLNAIESQCNQTGVMYDDSTEEAGFLDETEHASCTSVVRTALKRVTRPIPSLAKEGVRSSCTQNYCRYNYGCDYYSPSYGLTVCCPESCHGVGALTYACCIDQQSSQTCLMTLFWLLPYGIC